MKFCSKCGKELFDEAVICPGCGCPVVAPKPPVPLEEEVLEIVAQDMQDKIVLPIISLILWAGAVVIYLAADIFVGIVFVLGAMALTITASAITNSRLKDAGAKNANLKDLTKKLRNLSKTVFLNKIATITVAITMICFGVGCMALDSYKASIPYEYQHMYTGSYGGGLINQLDEIKDIHDYADAMRAFGTRYNNLYN